MTVKVCMLMTARFHSVVRVALCCAVALFGVFRVDLAQAASAAKPGAKPVEKPTAKGGAARSKDSDEAEEKLRLVAPPPGIWFPDWNVPHFDFFLLPILGASYESNKVTRTISDPDAPGGVQTLTATRRALTLEAGARFYLHDIPLVGHQGGDDPVSARPYDLPTSPLAMTLSPYAGYAFGRLTELEVSDEAAKTLGVEPLPKRSGNYHRILAGTHLTTYYRYFRYRIGLDFGRIFGDREILEPRNQAQLAQDFGIKLTERSSAHLSPTIGRIFTAGLADHSLQYTDIWLHLRWNPVLSALFDLGPGQGFDWFPQSSFGTRATYFKALFDWEIIGPLAVAARARYEIAVNNDFDTSSREGEESLQSRNPIADLGTPSAQALRFTDDLSLLLFAGLKHILGGVSVGYLSLHEYSNAFERKGKRTSRSSQGLGVQASLEI